MILRDKNNIHYDLKKIAIELIEAMQTSYSNFGSALVSCQRDRAGDGAGDIVVSVTIFTDQGDNKSIYIYSFYSKQKINKLYEYCRKILADKVKYEKIDTEYANR